jgi:chorismate mutase
MANINEELRSTKPSFQVEHGLAAAGWCGSVKNPGLFGQNQLSLRRQAQAVQHAMMVDQQLSGAIKQRLAAAKAVGARRQDSGAGRVCRAGCDRNFWSLRVHGDNSNDSHSQHQEAWAQRMHHSAALFITL